MENIKIAIDIQTDFKHDKDLLSICKALERYERKISGNNGITVVILK